MSDYPDQPLTGWFSVSSVPSGRQQIIWLIGAMVPLGYGFYVVLNADEEWLKIGGSIFLGAVMLWLIIMTYRMWRSFRQHSRWLRLWPDRIEVASPSSQEIYYDTQIRSVALHRLSWSAPHQPLKLPNSVGAVLMFDDSTNQSLGYSVPVNQPDPLQPLWDRLGSKVEMTSGEI
jgi:hypothetical protein